MFSKYFNTADGLFAGTILMTIALVFQLCRAAGATCRETEPSDDFD